MMWQPCHTCPEAPGSSRAASSNFCCLHAFPGLRCIPPVSTAFPQPPLHLSGLSSSYKSCHWVNPGWTYFTILGLVMSAEVLPRTLTCTAAVATANRSSVPLPQTQCAVTRTTVSRWALVGMGGQTVVQLLQGRRAPTATARAVWEWEGLVVIE